MFTIDSEEEKKEKEKKKQKILDEIIGAYEKKQEKNDKEDDNNKKKKAVKLGSKVGSNWVKNDNADNFLKCMLPTGLLIGTGGTLWVSGFLVGEISKAATFLNGISMPASVSGVILTSNFWIVVGCVAGLCLVLYGIVSLASFLIKTNNRSLQKGKKKSMLRAKSKFKNRNKFRKKSNFKRHNTKIESSYGYGENRNIKNINKYDKNDFYKRRTDKSNFLKNTYRFNEKNNSNINSPPFLNKEKRNNFEIRKKNNKYKNFNNSNNDYDKRNDYKGNAMSKLNKKHYYAGNIDKTKKI